MRYTVKAITWDPESGEFEIPDGAIVLERRFTPARQGLTGSWHLTVLVPVDPPADGSKS